MTSNLLVRPRTDAEAPMVASGGRSGVLEPFYANTWLRSLGPTGTTSVSIVRHRGTRSEPAGGVILPERSHAPALHQIRLMSGLTWQELSELFGVSRRSIHNWANGEALKTHHAQFVLDALAAMKILRRPSAAETRSALLARSSAGVRALDLLAQKKWTKAMEVVLSLPPMPVTGEPHQDILLHHPSAYFGAIIDRPASTQGHSNPGRSRRLRRRGQ